MKFQFTATSRITLEHNQGDATSYHRTTQVRLDVSNNLDAKQYIDRGVPKKKGVKPLTEALIQGLVANIHAAHDKEYWDSAEHLRYIISKLERGFSHVVDVKNDYYND